MKRLLIAGLLVIGLGLLMACQLGGYFVTVTPPSLKPTASATCEWPCSEQDKLTAQALLATSSMANMLTVQAVSGTPTPYCENWPCPADSLTLTAAASQTPGPSCENWPCPGDSLTLTASAGQILLPPSSTAPANVTIIPAAGDLGWGVAYGRITDRMTGHPVENAMIRCVHVSDRSPENVLGSGVTWTNADGLYSFSPAFFRDVDVITFTIEAPGYRRIESRVSFFAINALKTDFTLEPDSAGSISPTPTFMIMCTAPACSSGQGVLACGNPNGCPGGCGTVCNTFTPAP
jgi:hypothetical protein